MLCTSTLSEARALPRSSALGLKLNDRLSQLQPLIDYMDAKQRLFKSERSPRKPRSSAKSLVFEERRWRGSALTVMERRCSSIGASSSREGSVNRSDRFGCPIHISAAGILSLQGESSIKWTKETAECKLVKARRACAGVWNVPLPFTVLDYPGSLRRITKSEQWVDARTDLVLPPFGDRWAVSVTR